MLVESQTNSVDILLKCRRADSLKFIICHSIVFFAVEKGDSSQQI